MSSTIPHLAASSSFGSSGIGSYNKSDKICTDARSLSKLLCKKNTK